jgi:hypothetical protein
MLLFYYTVNSFMQKKLNPALCVKYTKVRQKISVQIPMPHLTKIGTVVSEMKLTDGGRKVLCSIHVCIV